jgi:hypothetical protein
MLLKQIKDVTESKSFQKIKRTDFSTVRVLVPGDCKSVKYKIKSKICHRFACLYSFCLYMKVLILRNSHIKHLPNYPIHKAQILSDVHNRTDTIFILSYTIRMFIEKRIEI